MYESSLGWKRSKTAAIPAPLLSPNWPVGCAPKRAEQQLLQAWLTPLVDALHGRIHGFNVSVAYMWAEQERQLEKAGQRMPVEDSYIAATARRHRLTIATGNDHDFRRLASKYLTRLKSSSS